MTAIKVPGADLHRQAVEMLQIAADAIDQAHAILRDLKLHDCISYSRGPYRQTLNSAHGIVSGLLDDLKTCHCPDCDAFPMTESCYAGQCLKGEATNG